MRGQRRQKRGEGRERQKGSGGEGRGGQNRGGGEVIVFEALLPLYIRRLWL